jgi:hypothetical protein
LATSDLYYTIYYIQKNLYKLYKKNNKYVFVTNSPIKLRKVVHYYDKNIYRLKIILAGKRTVNILHIFQNDRQYTCKNYYLLKCLQDHYVYEACIKNQVSCLSLLIVTMVTKTCRFSLSVMHWNDHSSVQVVIGMERSIQIAVNING